MVIMQGLTQKEILEYVEMARIYPLEVRFLEFMPLCGSGWDIKKVLPIQKVRAIVREHYDLEPLQRDREVAESYALKEGPGRVGFIASLTESFCDSCSRLRLTANGGIRPCLFSDLEVSVKDLLRAEPPDNDIIQSIRLAVQMKPAGNMFHKKPFEENQDEKTYRDTPMIRFVGG